MKTIVVYSSKHHMNTEKVAQAIAGELKAEVRKVTDVRPQDLDGFDLVGSGSGINGFDVHPEMHALVDGLGDAKGRRAFLFSTCASRRVWTGKLREKLSAKGYPVVSEFCCAGALDAGPVQGAEGSPERRRPGRRPRLCPEPAVILRAPKWGRAREQESPAVAGPAPPSPGVQTGQWMS